MSVRRNVLLGVAVMASMAASASAATINVPGTELTIQAGIDAAATGDTVLVAPGTYDETIDFHDKAISVVSSGGAKVTTIHPSVPGTVVVIGTGAPTLFRGFTVQSGPIPSTTSFASLVFASGATGVIEQNVLTGNSSCAAALMIAGSVTARNNVIWGNSHACTGGGIVAVAEAFAYATLADNLIVNNVGGNSPVGVKDSTATGNIVVGNSGATTGGIELIAGTLANNLIVKNRGNSSGGISLQGWGPSGEIVNNTVADNAGPRAVNVRITAASTYTMRNNIFAAAGTPVLTCDSTYNPTLPVLDANNLFNGAGALTSGSCPNPTGANGNISANSAFVDAAKGDYHLLPTSPLIDAGSSTGAPASDMDADPRPLDGGSGAKWDIGADESAATSLQTTITGGPGAASGANPAPFTFTSPTAGATFECDIDMAGFLPCTSPVAITDTTARYHAFRVRAKNAAGVDRTPATRLYTIDVVPPNTTISGTPSGVDNSGLTEASFTASEADATFECALDGAAFASCMNPHQMTVALGDHTLMVRAVDLAGNVDATPAQVRWTTTCTRFGSGADDDLVGTDAADAVCGQAGNDTIRGLGDADRLFGGEDDDLLDGGAGPDLLDGGPGIDDVADYSGRQTPVTVTLGDGLPDGGAEDGSGDTIDSSVDDVWGGAGNDALTGDGGDNIIAGGPGADVIRGGNGFDYVDYARATGGVTVDLDGAPGDDGQVGEGDTVGADVEAIFGGAGADRLTGNDVANYLDGGLGDDTVTGGSGGDLLDTGDGNDTVFAIDGIADDVDCGNGIDVAYADAVDRVFNCETRSSTPPTTPVTPPAPIVVPVHRLRMLGATGTSRAGVAVPVRCDSTRAPKCRVKIVATTVVVAAGKKRTYTLGVVDTSVAANANATVRIKLNARAVALFKTKSRLTVRLVASLGDGGALRVVGARNVMVRRVTATRKDRATNARRLQATAGLVDLFSR